MPLIIDVSKGMSDNLKVGYVDNEPQALRVRLGFRALLGLPVEDRRVRGVRMTLVVSSIVP